MKRRLVTILIGLIAGLTISEVYLRYGADQEINLAWECYQPSLTMHYVYAPNSRCRYKRFKEYDTEPRINNVGLRSDFNMTLKKPEGIRRVLIVGDSLVAAHEVEEKDTLVKLLENQWQAQGLSIELLNGGIRGYSPFLSYFYLKFQALALEPDVVILLVNTADFAENQRYRQFAKYDLSNGKIVSVWPDWNFYYRRLEAVKPIPATQAGVQWWPELTLKLIKINGRVLINRMLRRPVWYGQVTIGDWRTDSVAIERDQWLRDDRQTLMSGMEETISQIKSLLAQKRIRFYLVLMPMGYEVSQNEWNLGRVTWGLERNRLYEPTGLRELGEWASKNQIEVIDLITPLRQFHQEAYFFPKDGHLTVAGHKKVAEALEQALKEGVN